jgi:hypothetical protein
MNESLLQLVRPIARNCRKFTIPDCTTDAQVRDCIVAIIIASLKDVDPRSVHTNVLPGRGFDWELLELQKSPGVLTKNLVGDSNHWATLLNQVVFDNCFKQKSHVHRFPPIELITQCISNYSGRGLDTNDALRILVLLKVAGLKAKVALETYLSTRLGMVSSSIIQEVSSGITAAFFDGRHALTDAMYTEALCEILVNCAVQVEVLAPALLLYRENRVGEAGGSSPAYAGICREPINKRVSLCAIAEQLEKIARLKNPSAHISLITTFAAFDTAVQFPLSVIDTTRQRCYLVACMSDVLDVFSVANKLVHEDVAVRICNNPVGVPNVVDVCAAIKTLEHVKMSNIDDFKQSVFSKVARNYLAEIDMVTYMHLYIATFQKAAIWRQCWNLIHPINSLSTIKDVELFVYSHKLDATSFASAVATRISRE